MKNKTKILVGLIPILSFGCSNSLPDVSMLSSNNAENSVSSSSSISSNIEVTSVFFEEINIDYPFASAEKPATCSYRTFPGERIISSKRAFESLNSQYFDFRTERENRIDSSMDWNSECLILFDYQSSFRKQDLFVSDLSIIQDSNNELLSNLLVTIYSESAFPMVDTDFRRKKKALEKNDIFFRIKCKKSDSLLNARFVEIDNQIKNILKR